MIRSCQFRWKLKQLQASRARVVNLYTADIERAKADRDEESYQRLVSGMHFETDLVDDEIHAMLTTELRRQAEARLLPMPDYEDPKMWRESVSERGRKYLSTGGIHYVRSLLREDAEASRSRAMFWLSMLTGLVGTVAGLIGTLIAYAALKAGG